MINTDKRRPINMVEPSKGENASEGSGGRPNTNVQNPWTRSNNRGGRSMQFGHSFNLRPGYGYNAGGATYWRRVAIDDVGNSTFAHQTAMSFAQMPEDHALKPRHSESNTEGVSDSDNDNSESKEATKKLRQEMKVLTLNFDREMEAFNESPGPRVKLIKPPGFHLLHAAEYIFSKKTYSSVFEPLISDLQNEYIEALAAGREWKARAIRIQYVIAFAEACFSLLRSSAIGRLLSKTKLG